MKEKYLIPEKLDIHTYIYIYFYYFIYLFVLYSFWFKDSKII